MDSAPQRHIYKREKWNQNTQKSKIEVKIYKQMMDYYTTPEWMDL